ncbi:valine--tRNA ligase [bacterium]|nr:valine--tRNA ligase [bacterium]
MEKTYSPASIETARYQEWESSGRFGPAGQGNVFSIVIPPPNVTGNLHIGHALEHTIIDMIIRQKRMQGDTVEWLPGTDHAGIATQNVVEKALSSQGKSRADFSREAFVDRVWEWKQEYGSTITRQMRRLGTSVDWSRERFTMDEGCATAVRETFITLYNQGYIYRGSYIINWCPRCTTALSDVEVNHETAQGHLWHIAYPLENDLTQSITVATTRPETMLGDMAVAVHPDDSRYKHLIGQNVVIPIINRTIPIIADNAVDPTFGTGAVKVTPAHDLNDYEMGKRHAITPLLIMTETGVMNDNVPAPFKGLDRFDCRLRLISDLSECGALVKTVDHELSRGHCYRCKTVIEPYLSKQWFVAMSKLAGPAIDAVKKGDIEFVPPRFGKLYFDWMENIRDWCISRQIWWGHRIPVWYPEDAPDEFIVASAPPSDGRRYRQDEDVLDTWFSSALWPFSTFGWPEATDDLSRFYPNTMLVTGYDILTFWVSRMITMGLALTGKAPFKKVYVHGLVRDIHGKKMSKSSGNVIDPLKLIDQFGADALRFSLASLATLGGQDIKFSEDKVEASRNFANKVWNASRFVIMGLDTLSEPIPYKVPVPTTLADKWILSRFEQLLTDLDQCATTYHFALSTENLWEFTWNIYCDWYLELSKIHKAESLPTLIYVLLGILKVLHPVMPFITEEIWKTCLASGVISGMESEMLMTASWPKQTGNRDEIAEAKMDRLIAVIREVRNIRQSLNVAPGKMVDVIFVAPKTEDRQLFNDEADYLKKLAKINDLSILESLAAPPAQAAAGAVDDIQIFVPLSGLIDIEQEAARLRKKLEGIIQQMAGTEAKLAQPSFKEKAPSHVVEKLEQQLESLRAEHAALTDQLAALK